MLTLHQCTSEHKVNDREEDYASIVDINIVEGIQLMHLKWKFSFSQTHFDMN